MDKYERTFIKHNFKKCYYIPTFNFMPRERTILCDFVLYTFLDVCQSFFVLSFSPKIF